MNNNKTKPNPMYVNAPYKLVMFDHRGKVVMRIPPAKNFKPVPKKGK